MIKKLTADPSFYLLLAGNVWCIYYYQSGQAGFETVIWIYWFQSVIIGLFNFLEILTARNIDTGTFKINDEPVTAKNRGCAAFFFLVHYGGFHIAYLVFIAIKFHRGINTLILFLGVGAFLAEAIIGFARRKLQTRKLVVNMGALFFLPYLRVVPMHLVILGPAFLNIQPSIIFLLLKAVADIISYFVAGRVYKIKAQPTFAN
jgi:hypothetical protein